MLALLYTKRAIPVTAVQINLDLFPMEGSALRYFKWGGYQKAHNGDWLVDNQGEVYTVNKTSFAATYKAVEGQPGQYVKVTPVWAYQAETNGSINTKEGISHYGAGDYVVYNNADLTDGYCMSREKFESMYDKA